MRVASRGGGGEETHRQQVLGLQRRRHGNLRLHRRRDRRGRATRLDGGAGTRGARSSGSACRVEQPLRQSAADGGRLQGQG